MDKQPKTENNSAPVKVLLADNNEDDQKIFNEAIKEGHINAKLTVANNGAELMENLRDENIPNPDVIFLDVHMPGKDGPQCLHEIKLDAKLKNICTVMYTTSERKQDVDEAFREGANLFVIKPIFFMNLIRLLQYIIKPGWKTLLLKPFRKNFVLSEDNLPNGQSFSEQT